MKVIQFALELNYVNVFLAVDTTSKSAFLVDCGAFEQRIKEYIENHTLNLKFLLITHSHYDHVDGLKDFKKDFRVPIYSATKNYDVQISEEDQIPFENDSIRIFETPGHTPDGISFYINNAIFVGDAIFSGAVGGTSARNQFKQQRTAVWNKILTLPDNTIIYPGHGAPSMVGIERLYNPFFAECPQFQKL